MFGYDNLLWSVAFPVVCAVMMYSSMALALLGRCRYEMHSRTRKKAMTEVVLATETALQVGGGGATATVHMTASQVHNNSNNNTTCDEEGVVVFGCPVEMPQSLSRDVRAVLHRAVVVVGGDIAYAPRMQRHAASLARSGLYSEVVLVGVCASGSGKLMDDLLRLSGQPTPLCFGQWHATSHNNNNSNNNNSSSSHARNKGDDVLVESSAAVWHDHAVAQATTPTSAAAANASYNNNNNNNNSRSNSHSKSNNNNNNGHSDDHSHVAGDASADVSGEAAATTAATCGSVECGQQQQQQTCAYHHRTLDATAAALPISFGCDINTSYLLTPPELPSWLPLRLADLPWVVRTLYHLVHYVISFTAALLCTMVLRVNVDGKLLVTDVVLVQIPPGVPFVLLIKYIARPLAFVYNVIVYYAFLVPMSWLYMDAMRDARAQCALQYTCDTTTFFGSDTCLLSAMERARQRHLQRACAAAETTTTTRAASSSSRTRWRRRFLFWPLLVTDWHNYGYTVLQHAQRPHWACALYRSLERRLCGGDVNATVSAAMRRAVRTHVSTRTTHNNDNSNNDNTPRNDDNDVDDVLVVYDAPEAPPSSRAARRPLLYDVLASVRNYEQQQQQQRAGGGDDMGSKCSLWGIAPPPSWVVEDATAERDALLTAASAATTAATTSTATAAGGNAVDTPSKRDNNGSGNTTRHITAATTPTTAAAAAAALQRHSRRRQQTQQQQQQQQQPQHSRHTRHRRGVVIVGATSWTPEDDYTMLIDALQRLDARLAHVERYAGATTASVRPRGRSGGSNGQQQQQQQQSLPNVWVVITGRGGARARFERNVRAARLSPHITVSTVFLPAYEDYAALLASADVGLCMHLSTSGLDLPMKAINMLSAGLPLVAYRYDALQELVGPPTTTMTTTPASSSSSRRAHNNNNNNDRSGPVECACGWLFASVEELEMVFAHVIGLHQPAWRDVVRVTCASHRCQRTRNDSGSHGDDDSDDSCDDDDDDECNRSASSSDDDIDDTRTRARRYGSSDDAATTTTTTRTGDVCRLTMSLSQARERAQAWRASRRTWRDEWNATMLPMLCRNT